jgi:Na+-transporting NADH:ubiquinone oxidoreductase subunit NqrF
MPIKIPVEILGVKKWECELSVSGSCIIYKRICHQAAGRRNLIPLGRVYTIWSAACYRGLAKDVAFDKKYLAEWTAGLWD